MTPKRHVGKVIAAKAQSKRRAQMAPAANPKSALYSLMLEEVIYTFDMFIMPLRAVWLAVASGFRRNLFEIEKHRPKPVKQPLPNSLH
ncbi:MAG: hypothetical protein WCO04_12115 [Pseudomonadota bacterium]